MPWSEYLFKNLAVAMYCLTITVFFANLQKINLFFSVYKHVLSQEPAVVDRLGVRLAIC